MAHTAPSTVPIRHDVKENFLKWCGSHSSVTIHESIDLFHSFTDDYRGVLAKKDIAEGTELVRISRACCIGPETDDNSDDEKSIAMRKIALTYANVEGNASTDPSLKLTPACFTVLRLLHELGEGTKSKFYDYLSILPRDHRIPLEWNDREVELLKGTAVEPLVVASDLDSQFKTYERLTRENPTLWAADVCNKDSFVKALNWVRSRGFTVCGEPYMIPCADMFNHNPANQSAIIGILSEDCDDIYVMRAIKPIKSGAEIYSSFGQLSNAHLLNSYGFILQNNPFDSVIMPFKFVLNSCKEVFLKVQSSAKEDNKWEAHLKTVAQNGFDLSEFQNFILTKYDMIPESLTSAIQEILLIEDSLLVYSVIIASITEKLNQFSLNFSDELDTNLVGKDAFDLCKHLVHEETVFLKDLKVQLMQECMITSDDDDDLNCDEQLHESGSESDRSQEKMNRKKRRRRKH